ncbi:MAG TPA: DUF5317 family protein [Solirubrobacteraceae bacterium]|jgi:hypothetical protein
MILALVYMAVLASVPLAGGKLSALADLPLRRSWLAAAAIAIQVVVISLLPGGSHTLHAGLHLASYGLLGAFAWANRRLTGVPLVALGGLMNFIAIAANGGVMPTDPQLAASLAHTTARGDFINSAVQAHPKLLFLGDILATPASWPVHNIYSVGDVVIVLGVGVLVHVACGSRLGRLRLRRRPAAAPARS